MQKCDVVIANMAKTSSLIVIETCRSVECINITRPIVCIIKCSAAVRFCCILYDAPSMLFCFGKHRDHFIEEEPLSMMIQCDLDWTFPRHFTNTFISVL